jgi:hypothetical protein
MKKKEEGGWAPSSLISGFATALHQAKFWVSSKIVQYQIKRRNYLLNNEDCNWFVKTANMLLLIGLLRLFVSSYLSFRRTPSGLVKEVV